MGPLFFSLCWRPVVEGLPESLRLNLWYLDDGHLVGTKDDLRKAFQVIEAAGEALGVRVNAAKCRLWGPALFQQTEDVVMQGTSWVAEDCPHLPDDMIVEYREADGAWPSIPIVPWKTDTGLKVLGLPVCFPGSSDFAVSAFAGVVGDLERCCSVLHALGDTQCEHLLLRYCLDACRIMHYLRGVDCRPLEPLIKRATLAIRMAWADVVGQICWIWSGSKARCPCVSRAWD